MKPVIPKKELIRLIKNFLDDPKRGISIEMFCDLCGIASITLIEVFRDEELPLTEYIQRKVSKGYQEWANGEVAIMANKDRTKFLQYRKEPKPRLVRSMGLQVVNGQISMKIGVRNRSDYSYRNLDEQLRGK